MTFGRSPRIYPGRDREGTRANSTILTWPRYRKETTGLDETLPGDAARVLAGLLGTTDPLWRFGLRLVYDWRGAEPRFTDATGMGLRSKDYRRPAYPDEPWEHLTIREVVYQAIKLRNAVAHSYLPKMGDVVLPGEPNSSPEETHWLNNPANLFWASDKKDGISVQAGCARGVVALFVQLIDQCIAALAGVLTDKDDKAAILASRLPEEWFWQTYRAGSRRGVDWDVPLWRWKSLKRLSAEDFW